MKLLSQEDDFSREGRGWYSPCTSAALGRGRPLGRAFRGLSFCELWQRAHLGNSELCSDGDHDPHLRKCPLALRLTGSRSSEFLCCRLDLPVLELHGNGIAQRPLPAEGSFHSAQGVRDSFVALRVSAVCSFLSLNGIFHCDTAWFSILLRDTGLFPVFGSYA